MAEERRDPIEGKLANMASDIDELTASHDLLRQQWADLAARFAEAFPGGDHVGHCRYHMLMIEEIEGRKRLRAAVTEKTISGLLWGLLVGLGIAVWQYIKEAVKR